jgi:hypothetical protein
MDRRWNRPHGDGHGAPDIKTELGGERAQVRGPRVKALVSASKILAAGLAALALAGCASIERVPFTQEQQAAAVVPGIPNARIWSDERVDVLLARSRTVGPQVRGPVNVLALSGGGSNGAFGAGLLAGWTARGTRPEFSVVTGASAGALIAPFAFLGPGYDEALQALITEGFGENLLQIDGLQAIFGAAAFKAEPLKRLVARYVDPTMIERVALEHRKGRRLLIVTTNIDAQRTAVWDMGAIAASGQPNTVQLFRDVLVASASIPGVFQPVLIDVEGEGRRFAEMHVDGGVRANLLVVPESFLLSSVPPVLPGTYPRVYIVLNSKLDQEFEVVQSRALQIVSRSFGTAVKANTQNTLIATYDFARRNRWDFNLAAIDGDYPTTTSYGFDSNYMRGLYQYGYEQGSRGNPWRKTLPETYNTVPEPPPARPLRGPRARTAAR